MNNDFKAAFACNTSAYQYINFVSNREMPMPLNGIDLDLTDSPPSVVGSYDSMLNASSALELSLWAADNILEFIAPFHQRSLLFPSVELNNLSYLSIAYFCYFEDLYSTFGRLPLFLVPTNL